MFRDKPMKYSPSVAKAHEDRGIGLLAGAVYVLGANINDDHLREVEQQDFKAMRFPNCRLIVVNGRKSERAKGAKILVRFGRLDESGKFVKMINSQTAKEAFASLSLLDATHHDPADFVLANLPGRIVRVRKPTKQVDMRGLLVGESQRFASLLSLKGDILFALDVEQTGNTREVAIVSPVSEQEAEDVRAELGDAMKNAKFVPDHSFSVNIQLVFSRSDSST